MKPRDLLERNLGAVCRELQAGNGVAVLFELAEGQTVRGTVEPEPGVALAVVGRADALELVRRFAPNQTAALAPVEGRRPAVVAASGGLSVVQIDPWGLQ